jgi:HPt (histidine-containing phosphotransfer) domain-containing protein
MATEISPEKLAELKSLGGDELITKLLAKFTENSAKLIADAQAALAANDAAKVDYCVHTLKGSAMSLGLNSMSAILVDLNVRTKAQNLANAGEDLAKLAKLLDEVKQYKAEKFP